MSSPEQSQPAVPPPPPPPAPAPAPPFWKRLGTDRRLLATCIVAFLLLAGAPFALLWIVHRFTHSITNDAFVESRLVNIGPQVFGYITMLPVEEHTQVKKGELIAQIDPLPYQRQVDLARAKLTVAEKTLSMEEAVLDRLVKEVPRKIAIAEQELQIARTDETKAKHALELTRQNVDKAIKEAEATLEAANAVFVNADEDYKRFTKLFKEKSVPERRLEEATKIWKTAKADVGVAKAKLARAEAAKLQIDIADQTLSSAGKQVQKASESVQLAEVGNLQIEESRRQVLVKAALVEEARRSLDVAQTNLNYTHILAPFDGVVVKRYRSQGDYAPVGSPILTLYNQNLIYVTAHMEETRLEGVSPGNDVRLDVDAFSKPFHGRVLWIGKATGANFALVPRDLSSGEFTKVVQRVPIRIWIEKDERWPHLRPGLSVTVTIDHGPGDPAWAAQEASKQLQIETGLKP